MNPDLKSLLPASGVVAAHAPFNPLLPASASRRAFLRSTAALAAATAFGPPGRALFGQIATAPVPAVPPSAESLVKVLYDSLKAEQRKEVCFPWDYTSPKQGLLRTRVENNWRITKPIIKSTFFTCDQQALIRAIFEGITNPAWHARFDKQLQDDVGGFGNRQSIALFGEPGAGKSEFVLTSRHMTLRCDGDSAEHVAFGGPILYAHEGKGFYEKPDHPGNVFWFQAVEANKLFHALMRNIRRRR